MATRDIVNNPCEDECGTLLTDRTFQGAPIYRCPGCDSEWIDEAEMRPYEGLPPASPEPPA